MAFLNLAARGRALGKIGVSIDGVGPKEPIPENKIEKSCKGKELYTFFNF